jgi:hypothetical protein
MGVRLLLAVLILSSQLVLCATVLGHSGLIPLLFSSLILFLRHRYFNFTHVRPWSGALSRYRTSVGNRNCCVTRKLPACCTYEFQSVPRTRFETQFIVRLAYWRLLWRSFTPIGIQVQSANRAPTADHTDAGKFRSRGKGWGLLCAGIGSYDNLSLDKKCLRFAPANLIQRETTPMNVR